MAQAAKFASLFTLAMLDELGLDESPYAASAMKKDARGYIVLSTHPNHAALHRAMTEAQMAPWFRRAWRRFHRWTLRAELDLESAMKWLLAFAITLPNGECKCQTDFVGMVRAYPPILTGRDDLFAWGVEIHNLVNDKLRRPRYPLARARGDYELPNTEFSPRHSNAPA